MKKNKDCMIRSTDHTLNNANSAKQKTVKQFLAEYRTALQEFVDYLWDNPAYIKNKLVLDIKNDILNSVSFMNYNTIKSKTELSGRGEIEEIDGILFQKKTGKGRETVIFFTMPKNLCINFEKDFGQ